MVLFRTMAAVFFIHCRAQHRRITRVRAPPLLVRRNEPNHVHARKLPAPYSNTCIQSGARTVLRQSQRCPDVHKPGIGTCRTSARLEWPFFASSAGGFERAERQSCAMPARVAKVKP